MSRCQRRWRRRGSRFKVQLDLSFGDPIEAHEISYPTLLGDHDIELLGYPIELSLAEKISTMMARGQANTRDRDFADIALLARIHTIDAGALQAALARTAEHRAHPVVALSNTLNGHASNRQQAWATLRQRSPRCFSAPGSNRRLPPPPPVKSRSDIINKNDPRDRANGPGA